jgi:16S rRNA G966 N2-methylase RsmD
MKWDKKFDIFYLDPPYYSDLYDKTLKIIENKSLLNTNGLIILEKPSSVIVDLGSFLCVKEKKYGDKLIQYLKNRE